MRKILHPMLLWLLLNLPVAAYAAFDVAPILQETLDAPILDVAAHPEDEMVFLLTKGEVLIYSTEEKKILDRIAVDEQLDGLTYQKDNRLVLTAAESPMISVLQINQIFEIDISGRAVKGPPGAKATVVVFDDYQ
jgi:hypothetical protein